MHGTQIEDIDSVNEQYSPLYMSEIHVVSGRFELLSVRIR